MVSSRAQRGIFSAGSGKSAGKIPRYARDDRLGSRRCPRCPRCPAAPAASAYPNNSRTRRASTSGVNGFCTNALGGPSPRSVISSSV